MGRQRCQLLIERSEQGIGLTATAVGDIPASACEGQMTFVKRTLLDEIYICFKGKTPTAKSYHVILTDSVPVYTEDGIVPGGVNAIANAATAILSTYVSGNVG